jgi:hypothetical protein
MVIVWRRCRRIGRVVCSDVPVLFPVDLLLPARRCRWPDVGKVRLDEDSATRSVGRRRGLRNIRTGSVKLPRWNLKTIKCLSSIIIFKPRYDLQSIQTQSLKKNIFRNFFDQFWTKADEDKRLLVVYLDNSELFLRRNYLDDRLTVHVTKSNLLERWWDLWQRPRRVDSGERSCGSCPSSCSRERRAKPINQIQNLKHLLRLINGISFRCHLMWSRKMSSTT